MVPHCTASVTSTSPFNKVFSIDVLLMVEAESIVAVVVNAPSIPITPGIQFKFSRPFGITLDSSNKYKIS